MASPIRSESQGAAAWLTIGRPEVKNALNLDVIEALSARLADLAQDATVRAIVLQGADGDFSSGGDIQDMIARRGAAVVTYDRLRRGLMGVVLALTRHPKPVLALVDGVCLGAGAGLAMACDAILATTRSTFGFPFPKVGLVPDTGTSWLLPHIVGVQNARRLLLTAETITAEEAAGMGLVTRVLPDAKALAQEAEAWTTRFAGLPATAVRDVKRLFWANIDSSLETAVTHEAILQGVRFTSDEHAAAVDAFLKRRKPTAPR